MGINRISVSNFKSFDALSIDLQSFNVVVGANASGKSNFVEIFNFLRDISRYGLANAISLQGGIDYLRNIAIGAGRPSSFEFTVADEMGTSAEQDGRFTGVILRSATYRFVLDGSPGRYTISEDVLETSFDIVEYDYHKSTDTEVPFRPKEVLGSGKLHLANQDGRVRITSEFPPSLPFSEEHLIPSVARDQQLPRGALLFESRMIPFPVLAAHVIDSTPVYDFDPRPAKKAIAFTGLSQLDASGSNLPMILNTILSDPRRRSRFANLMTELLPFVRQVEIARFADRFLLLQLSEQYTSSPIPASLLSDGTISVAALIVALYFTDTHGAIFEEPDRNLHPSLVMKLVAMMKDASRSKQLLITTHNPEIVKHAGLEDLILVSRGEAGFSKVTRPSGLESVRTFLANEIGVEELFIKNLLEE
jgi:predicted ATPase